MRLVIGLFITLLIGGFVVVFVSRVRHAAHRIGCSNNLRQIGLALQTHHDFYRYFPTGTVANAELSPEKRLSWIVQIWPSFMAGGIEPRFDLSKAWDAEENCPPRFRFKQFTENLQVWYDEHPMSEARCFLCPANPVRGDANLPSPTHYLGIAGVGDDAAELPVTDPRAGFFGHDRKISLSDVKSGASATVAVAEAIDGGPWSAGGRATVRGLSTAAAVYFGEGGQFASMHRESCVFCWSPPVVTNVLFADASVRPLTAALSPRVFEAMSTIAGKERIDPVVGE